MATEGTVLRAAAVRAGVVDPAVLDAVAAVERSRYLPPDVVLGAARDAALPIPCGQTTSQPSLIALMLESLQLRSSSRVLEIGTGHGYEAAVLSLLVAEVWTVERIPELADVARANLADLPNVHVIDGDGARGLPAHAPYDAIVVAARAPEVPEALLDQLAAGGRLVAPIGGEDVQRCLVLQRSADGSRIDVGDDLGAVSFVPLVEG